VSCSYGPGRYDDNYEQKGIDYPVGFVRWTEQRNFEAVLHAISTGKLDVKSLITEKVPLADFKKIYGDMGKSGAIASILVYPEGGLTTKDTKYTNFERTIKVGKSDFKGVKGSIGIIGAGNFTKMTVLPALKKSGAPISFISSANGLSGTHLAKKYNIAHSTTDYREILNDPGVGMVMITTRHDLHASMVIDSIKAGKHVFVEKPLCLSLDELEEIKKVLGFKFYVLGEEEDRQGSADLKLNTSNLEPVLIVGFNRRFSPHIQAIKKALGNQPGPMNLTATMNAGAIPKNVWVHDMETGGGRIIGEACHYLDLLSYLAGSPIQAVCMNALGPNPQVNTDQCIDSFAVCQRFQRCGELFCQRQQGYSKERLEIYSRGRIAVMDNFQKDRGVWIFWIQGAEDKDR
jgi:predicted dehydrogenase